MNELPHLISVCLYLFWLEHLYNTRMDHMPRCLMYNLIGSKVKGSTAATLSLDSQFHQGIISVSMVLLDNLIC